MIISSCQVYDKNYTLEFLKGYHTLPKEGDVPYTSNVYLIRAEKLIMLGKHTEAIIRNTQIGFYVAQELQIRDLTLRTGQFHISTEQGKAKINLFYVILIDFILFIEDVAQVQLNNCKFYSGASPLTMYKSQVLLSGEMHFFNSNNSALVAYSTTITLSGNISFVNNSGIRGGAMALCTSTIYLTDSLNVSFINNSAQETGGAIHIEPDMTRNLCFTCFYEVQDQGTASTLYFSGNVAKFGGGNIYGTSLYLCEHLNRQDRDVSFLTTASTFLVSSDPIKVCLCSDGQPQCKNVPRTLANKRIHPGETFTIPAILVGGDYGTTIGTVHASFISPNISSVPVFEADHQYDQWIGNISACTNIKYTVYSKQDFKMYLTVSFSDHTEVTKKKLIHTVAMNTSPITFTLPRILRLISQSFHVRRDLLY